MPRNNDQSRDLLLGLLALQNGLLDQAQLVAAFHAWTRDKSRPLADHLLALGHLELAHRPLLEGLAAAHVALHGGDAEKSLGALQVGPTTCETLARAAGPDVRTTLAHVGSTVMEHDIDGDRTRTYAGGSATSNGQRFRVLRPHAQGGLGAVFVAMDNELHREVALKQILDQHADDPVSRQRFLLEAEITGGLEHPGVVPVYSLGTYGDGRPYYAMRFVSGESLKESIGRFHGNGASEQERGRRSLELRKLLRRFLDVCNAIDYAHARGVLHRDIKPSNVILGKHGETLVVDWGLAKATGRVEPGSASRERLLVPGPGSGSAETLPGSALGTPAYMSPEQALGDLERLGPRSDVYSLGATLYCLLTGTPPFSGDAGTVLRAVRGGQFRPPRQLDPSIDPALAAVCLKAMALDPEDRYRSPRALAEEIERWMADEPVTAWREPWTRRACRWAWRNRTPVTAAAAALLMALAGTAVVLAVQTNANRNLRTANIDLAIANTDLAIANAKVTATNADLQAANEREHQRFDLALDAIKLFHGEISKDLLLKERQFEKLRTQLLGGAADFYNRLEGLVQGQTDPRSRAALGRAYDELATLTGTIGNKRAALSVHRKALAVRRELARRPGAELETQLDVARTLLSAGLLQQEMGDSAGALAAYEEARDLAEGVPATDRASEQVRPVLGLAYLRIGYVLLAIGKPEEAWAAGTRARAIWQALADANPQNSDFQRELVESLHQIGALLTVRGHLPEALAARETARAIAQALVEAHPDVAQYKTELAHSHNNIAWLLGRLGRSAEAVASREHARSVWQSLVDANPNVTHFQSGLALSLVGIGAQRGAEGRLAESADAYRQAVTIWERLPALLPGDHYNVACTHALLAGLARRHGSGLPAAAWQTEAELAMTWLHKAVARGFRDVGWMRIDPDLDSLRSRPDFQVLLLDLAMPVDPFVH